MSTTIATLRDILVADHDLEIEALQVDTTLASLGIDSLGTIELLWTVEERYGIQLPTEPVQGLDTLGDVVSFIDGLVAAQSSERVYKDEMHFRESGSGALPVSQIRESSNIDVSASPLRTRDT